jgi:membrane protein DedA with SNARE-associated domain
MSNISTIVEHFPYLGIFVLLILGGIGLPFPEDATIMLSGFLVAHEVVKPLPIFLSVYAGLLFSDFFLYSVGKKYGRMVVEHKRFYKIISPDRLFKLEEKFKKGDVWVILIGRHFLGLRAQIFLVAGVMRMRPLKFIITDAATALLTIAFMGGIGYAGGNSIRILKKDLSRIEHIAIVVLIVLFAGWFFFRYFKKIKGGEKGCRN